MICKDCNINQICSIYKSIKEYSNVADIKIERCKHCTNELAQKEKLLLDQVKEKTTIAPTARVVDGNRLNELSKQNDKKKKEEQAAMELVKKPKPKQLKAMPLKLDTECVTCKANTFSADVSKCEECETIICSCCATYDAENEKLLCDKCWKEA